MHGERRVLLGRKIKGKSERELSPDPPRREAGSVRIGTKNDLLSRGKAAE
jgi:hypothetical protein